MKLNNYGPPADLSAQTIFDKVARHLHQQGGKAHQGAICQYRDESWRACAVGCLIPDNVYDPEMERAGVSAFPPLCLDVEPHYLALAKVLKTAGLEPFRPLLSSLQTAHDSWSSSHDPAYPALLRQVAAEHNLSTAVLDELDAQTGAAS